MSAASLAFRTIDLLRDADTAVAFRRDSYVCSFGSDTAFGDGAEYLAWLRDRVAKHPAGHVHVWKGELIIGQVEMLIRPGSPHEGYVNLFYLVRDERGRGFGAALHGYAMEFMRNGGARRVFLSVSPSNTRALAYYRKYGWLDRGPPPDDASVHALELVLD